MEAEQNREKNIEGKTIMNVTLHPDNRFEMKTSLSPAETLLLIEKIKVMLVGKLS